MTLDDKLQEQVDALTAELYEKIDIQGQQLRNLNNTLYSAQASNNAQIQSSLSKYVEKDELDARLAVMKDEIIDVLKDFIKHELAKDEIIGEDTSPCAQPINYYNNGDSDF